MKIYLYLAEDTSGVHSAGLVHSIAPDIEHRLRGSDNTAHCRQARRIKKYKIYKKGDFFDFFSKYCIQHCFICRPSDSIVSEDPTQDCCDLGIGSQTLLPLG